MICICSQAGAWEQGKESLSVGLFPTPDPLLFYYKVGGTGGISTPEPSLLDEPNAGGLGGISSPVLDELDELDELEQELLLLADTTM